VGVGSFDLLAVSEREVLVWYTPAREGHIAGEYAIPTPRLATAWERLCAGETLDQGALAQIGASQAIGRWLLALLAQLPGVRASEDADPTITLAFAVAKAPIGRTGLRRRRTEDGAAMRP
jgi:hypothetical protein